jgi:predicted metal-dependent peptidase
MRILSTSGFFGLLLMRLKYAVDEACSTVSTDGVFVRFSPLFLDQLSDEELDFVMLHELLHIILRHLLRRGHRTTARYDEACDIVVNSMIMQEYARSFHPSKFETLGNPSHLAPDGSEGYLYTSEEVYEMLPDMGIAIPSDGPGKMGIAIPSDGSGKSGFERGRAKQVQEKTVGGVNIIDDHSRWGMMEKDRALRDVWVKNIIEAAEAVSIQEDGNGRGTIPAFAKRLIEERKRSTVDWRTVLNDFLAEEICDYSLTPPDRRFDDSPFFLPDFNDTEFVARNLLFMIDTSGSMSDDAITQAFSEIVWAVDRFNGKLSGQLGFFDAAIIEPQRFEDMTSLHGIEATGGGGTDFQIILEYVAEYMQEDPPICIIIMTDGYAPFPDEELAAGIPVLWLITNSEVHPPWGRVGRITIE